MKFAWGRDVNIYLQRVNSSRLYFLKMAQFLPFHRLLLYWFNYSVRRGMIVFLPLGSGLWLWWNWSHMTLRLDEERWFSWEFCIWHPVTMPGSPGSLWTGLYGEDWRHLAKLPAFSQHWLASHMNEPLKSESYSPKLSLPAETKWNKDELLLLNSAHVPDSVNKINDCCCIEPLNLEVVCYTAIDTIPTEVSYTICIKIADSYTLLPDTSWEMDYRDRDR